MMPDAVEGSEVGAGRQMTMPRRTVRRLGATGRKDAGECSRMVWVVCIISAFPLASRDLITRREQLTKTFQSLIPSVRFRSSSRDKVTETFPMMGWIASRSNEGYAADAVIRLERSSRGGVRLIAGTPTVLHQSSLQDKAYD
jgi:hypothetical protein